MTRRTTKTASPKSRRHGTTTFAPAEEVEHAAEQPAEPPLVEDLDADDEDDEDEEQAEVVGRGRRRVDMAAGPTTPSAFTCGRWVPSRS